MKIGHLSGSWAVRLSVLLLATSGIAWSDEPFDVVWDIANPPGQKYLAEIDVSSGTWMSVDVSPDGKEIVFDLLGDIYIVPIEGGMARALSSGMAWDTQPRFNPNGDLIAFISDRDGADNLWLMDKDGNDLNQVTREKSRLISNPAWAPDGNFLAARKHFTGFRSVGAGEIWMYHRNGGDGIQMVEKPSAQKDTNDPAFSSDGQFLYYSTDVSPGDEFEYNLDPNGEIYQVRKIDLESGETTTVISGPGGAIRPVPSPDGNKIAFVRRVKANTVLFVKDLQNGSETVLYDELDRDSQEIYTTHSVYPNIAWMPDNSGLIFWSGGKIRRIDIASGASAIIPFRVRSTQTMMHAVRFPVPVAPAISAAKMLRWVTVSPTADLVVYQALGHLYIRELPNGNPKRVTTQDDHFEFFPSFSRDGKSLVYSTWSDSKLGTIRVVSSRGGRGKVVTSEPGHYVEPSFSPDGKTIVYRKLSGDLLRSPMWGESPGIYAVDLRGGQSRLLTKSGSRPHFSTSNNFLYVSRGDGFSENQLVKLNMSGGKEEMVLRSTSAGGFRVSPNGKWVAFEERFNAYVSPLPKAGGLLEIGADTNAIPSTQLSTDGGSYTNWSADSERIYWSLGPKLYSRKVAELSYPLDENSLDEMPPGLDIGFTFSNDIPSGRLALVGGRVITMRGDEIIENATIIIDRNRIAAIGASAEVTVPADATIIRVDGLTLMPGIIDAHWHGDQGAAEINPQQNWVNIASLAFGVTTVLDPSNNSSEVFSAKELAQAGLITAPRIFSTGSILYGADTPFSSRIDSVEDARGHLRRMKAVGAETVKSYMQPLRSQRQQIISAARETETNVVAEGSDSLKHILTQIVDGHTSTEHTPQVGNIYEDVMQLWAQSETGLTPTLIVHLGGLWGEQYWYQHTNVYDHKRLNRFVPRDVLDPVARRRIMAPDEEYSVLDVSEYIARLANVGVRVSVGGHGQREGLGAHWEMWLLALGGMVPMDVLRAATINPAINLGMDTEIGSLEVGKLADLIVLEKNPLVDIRNSEFVRYVILNGRIYDAESMDQIGNHAKLRDRFYFERPSL